ncbi:MAG: DNA/RNA nuclease SfsA [Proteobacteria bacterium]|nr:DNA/RNA nuclease SfsA [Pseudomonadota bacterium]
MRFDTPLIRGRLVRRYKRFLADIQLESGATVTAHVANPGSMLGLTEAGAQVLVWRSDDPTRKLAYSWEMVRFGRRWVGLNASRPNRLAEEAIAVGRIPALAGYGALRREVRYGENSRVDLVLGDGEDACYVEVKNAHLMRQRGLAEFPDSVTARGTKHLKELAVLARRGIRAVVLVVVQRQDCDRFAVAGDVDPAFAEAWSAAAAAGVEMLCHACILSPREIVLDKQLPILAAEAA